MNNLPGHPLVAIQFSMMSSVAQYNAQMVAPKATPTVQSEKLCMPQYSRPNTMLKVYQAIIAWNRYSVVDEIVPDKYDR